MPSGRWGGAERQGRREAKEVGGEVREATTAVDAVIGKRVIGKREGGKQRKRGRQAWHSME